MIQRVLACVSLSVVTCCALGCATPGATHPGTGATRSSATDLDPKERFLSRVQADDASPGNEDYVSITEFERIFGPSTIEVIVDHDTPDGELHALFAFKPGEFVEAVFQSTAERRVRHKQTSTRIHEMWKQGEIGDIAYGNLMAKEPRQRARLLDFERRCRQEGMRPYFSLFDSVVVVQADSFLRRGEDQGRQALAACERGPIEAWKFYLRVRAEDYAMQGRFGPAAQLFERLAEAEGDREQAFWKAAVAHVAAGNVQGAKTNLARFREAATAEQLTEADAAIRELEAKIATIGAPAS